MGESVTVNVSQAYNNYIKDENQISVTITSEEGLTTEYIDFTIYENPIVNLSAEVSEICFTDSLTLSSNPGYYSWTPATITGNSDVYYPSTSSEDMIFLTVTGEGGCTSSDSLVVVNDLPVVNLTVDNSEICLGESLIINTNSGYNNYDWTPSVIFQYRHLCAYFFDR